VQTTGTSHARNRRDQILDEATQLFSRHGFAGTSIRGIAGRCSITEAAIYRHFANKEDLYAEVLRHKAAQHDIDGYLAQRAGKGTVEDALTAVAEHILALTREDPGLVRLMFASSLEDGQVAAVLFKEVRLHYVQFLARELEQRIETGEIVPVDAFITARCFVGMVMDCALNYGIWERIIQMELRPRDVYCNTVPIFARGLRTGTAPDPARS